MIAFNIIDYPDTFFCALLIIALFLGAWLDRLYVGWRIDKLKTALDIERALTRQGWRGGR